MIYIFFCVEQIYLTNELIKTNVSNFYSRVFARVIILRCQDFIKLSKRYIKSHKELPSTIEAKLNDLENYYTGIYLRQRNKLSGHVQDIEFWERNTLWLDIESEKLNTLFNKTISFYKMLTDQDDYIELNEINYKIPEDIKLKLNEYNGLNDIENKPMMSSDAFSMTRYNTGGIIYVHPVQDKCGVILALNIILKYEVGLISILRSNSNLSLWVKIIIIIDMISLLDNLFTRPEISPNSIMYNKGLDTILIENDFTKSNKIVNDFKDTFDLNENYSKLRHLRNKIGGHIDIDINLEEYKERIMNLDMDILLDRYNVLSDLFNKICMSDFRLKIFNISPTSMKGVTQVESSAHVKPFDETLIPTQHFKVLDFKSEDDYNKYLELLSVENGRIPEEILDFFRMAFERSDVEEKIVFEKNQIIEYRKAHKFIEYSLSDVDISIATKLKLLEIINYAKNGFPNQLLYILLSTFDSNKDERVLKINYLFQLGEIGNYKNNKIFELLKRENIEGKSDFIIFYYSILSILKINICHDGIENFNHKNPITENEYTKFVKANIGDTPKRKVITSLLLASEMVFNTRLVLYLEKFRELLLAFFHSTIILNINGFLSEYSTSINDKEREDISQELKTNQLTFIFILLARKIEESGNDYYKLFYGLFIQLFRFYSGHDIHLEHLAYAHYKIEEYEGAIYCYNLLVKKNPENYYYFLRLLEVYSILKNKSEFIRYKKILLTRYEIKDKEKDYINELEKDIDTNC